MLASSISLGITGTLLMTLFMYLMSNLTKRNFKVVKILGTMLTFQTTPEKETSDSTLAISTGIIAHYAVGVLFALPYLFLYQHNVLTPTWVQSIVYGFLAGFVAMMIWRVFFLLHPNPPLVPLKTYLLDLLIGHVIFGLGCWIAFKNLVLPLELL